MIKKRILIVILAIAMAFTVMSFMVACNGTNETSTPPLQPRVFTYEEFGASGCGYVCDFDAIVATHAAANEWARENNAWELASVRAMPGATYLIESGLDENSRHQTAIIQTDVDWTGAEFIIDDTKVEYALRSFGSARPGFYERVWNQGWIFQIAPTRAAYNLPRADVAAVGAFVRDQEQINLQLPYEAVIIATDTAIRRYAREGENENPGSNQQDVFIIDQNGNVDMNAPIKWDFPNADTTTALRVYPMDHRLLTVEGGHFITINNNGNADDQFMTRGLNVRRSNTVINGLTRAVENEGSGDRNVQSTAAHWLANGGASYRGFVYFENTANVVLSNSTLAGRRASRRPSQLGTTRGTYDIGAGRAVNVTIYNVDQVNATRLAGDTDGTNYIADNRYWGIFASNFSKNIIFDGVTFSRFDSHMGVHNVTLKNSEFGHQNISIVGSGLLYINNVEVRGSNTFIWFRSDYGAKWDGDVYIFNSRFTTNNVNGDILSATNNGTFNFLHDGVNVSDIPYELRRNRMPRNVTIDGFEVNDGAAGSAGVWLFSVHNQAANAPFRFVWTEEITLRNFTTTSGNYRIARIGGWGGDQNNPNPTFANQLTIIR